MKHTLLASSAALFLFTSTVATAQTAPEPEATDIVVTANRTSSLLSKTPIAMSAITGDELIKTGVTNPTQIEQAVPNLSIVRGNGLQITIRGVTSTDNTEKGDPSAAFMVNGIYVARPQAQEVSFFDIERIEVLRGPQGTLYGRNSTAGVVNILSVKPTFEFGGRFDASYGNYNAANATAVINVPVGETLAIRVAANLDQRDNFISDGAPNDGVTLGKFKDNKSVRLSAMFRPTPDLSLLLVGDYSSIDGQPIGAVPPSQFYSNIATGPRPTFNAPTFLGLDTDTARRLSRNQAQQPFGDRTDKGVMGELNYTTGNVTLTYLGSYREFDRLEFANAANGAFSSDSRGNYWQTSHEVRLAYDNGPLKVQLGGYYFKEESGVLVFVNNLLGPNTRFGFDQKPTVAENKSVFGQATYEIAPDVRLTGGVRYSHDLKSRIGANVLDVYTRVVNSSDIGNFITRRTLSSNDAERAFSKVTWRAGIDYDSPLGLVFASVSTGYKAGGFNDGCETGQGADCRLPAGALYYQPETLTAYEGGFKFRISPELRLNGTVFHYDYADLQLSESTNLCGGPCQVTTNAARAKVDGVELDASLQPVARFKVRLALNWLNARYAQFRPNPVVNFAGRSLDRSPRWSWNAGVNYALPVGDGSLVFDALTAFRSRVELTDLANYAYFFQPAVTKTDVSVTYNAPDNQFYVGAFGINLENNLVVTSVGTGAFGVANFADPRTFGVRAGFKF